MYRWSKRGVIFEAGFSDWARTHAANPFPEPLGGGRYRIQIGNKTIDGVGFAMGVERMIAALEATGVTADQFVPKGGVFIASLGEAALKENMLLMQTLRQRGVACEMELTSRKIKAQMKRANKIGAQTVIIRGDNEIEKGTFVVKNMEEGTQQELELPDLIEMLESNR